MFKQIFARVKALISPTPKLVPAPVYVAALKVEKAPTPTPTPTPAPYRPFYVASREVRNRRRKDRQECRVFVRALNQARG